MVGAQASRGTPRPPPGWAGPPRSRGRPGWPTDQATLKRVLTATVRGAGKAPHQSCQRALLHQGEPSLAGQTRFSSLWRPTSHVGLISKMQGTAVRTAVSQVAVKHRASSYVLCSRPFMCCPGATPFDRYSAYLNSYRLDPPAGDDAGRLQPLELLELPCVTGRMMMPSVSRLRTVPHRRGVEPGLQQSLLLSFYGVSCVAAGRPCTARPSLRSRFLATA